MTAGVHELGSAFDDRNMFLQVALGLISLCGQFETLLTHHGALGVPPQLPNSEAPLIADVGPQIESPVLDFVLGLVAFSQQLLLHAEDAVTAPPPEPTNERRRYPLRRLLA